MSQTIDLREDATVSILPAPATPLAAALGVLDTPGTLTEARGARTPTLFSDAGDELSALVAGVGVFDEGARVRLRVTGEDRVRWLNGMVTNTVKALAPGRHNYTFILNAQGRIQGDATVFAFADHLLLETDRAQADRVLAHLDRFIIMDDVELSSIDARTALGLAGPGSAALLASLGLPIPAPGAFVEAEGLTGLTGLTIVGEDSPLESSPPSRFSLWVAEKDVAGLWQRLVDAGATPSGAVAVDALRMLEGTPLYGVDITEKTLAQETGQMRALNFNKGCYLGQEIVERVRSRANVHRGIRQFTLTGAPASRGAPLTVEGAVVGELTSIADVSLPGMPARIALGTVRTEAAGRAIEYPGGTAEPLSTLPLLTPDEKVV